VNEQAAGAGPADNTPQANLDASLAEVEWWFLRRGMPHFIADYDASTSVWTRAIPFLGVVYVALLVWDVWERPWSDRLFDAGVSIGVLLGAWIVGNLLRGHRPLARPSSVGGLELVVWVVGVSFPDVLDGDWSWLWADAILGVVILGVVYVVTAYGVFPLMAWVIERLLRSLVDVRAAAARALPMLLLFVSFFFLTTETWQTFARLEGVAYGLALLLFVVIGVAFVWSRLRPDVEELEGFADWDEVAAIASSTPAACLPVPGSGEPAAPDLTRRQRINTLLVAVSGQTILAALVALVMGLFFLVFGFLVIDEALIATWVGGEANVYLTLTLSGRDLVLTEELVRVSGFLATFSGFYFGVFSVTDPTFRQGLTDDSTTSLRESLAARELYLQARTSSNLSKSAEA